MGRLADRLRALRADALIIGSGMRAIAKRAARLLRSPYPVLYDPDRDVYRTYGLDRRLGMIQQSGTFVIDPAGIVRLAHAVTNPAASFPAKEVFAVLEQAGASGGDAT